MNGEYHWDVQGKAAGRGGYTNTAAKALAKVEQAVVEIEDVYALSVQKQGKNWHDPCLLHYHVVAVAIEEQGAEVGAWRETWKGTLDQFLENNELTGKETARLILNGEVILGGGAAPYFRLRIVD